MYSTQILAKNNLKQIPIKINDGDYYLNNPKTTLFYAQE